MTDWITTTEAAELVGKTPVTVRRWAREGLVDAAMSGGVWLVDRLDVERFFLEGEPRPIQRIDDNTEASLRQAWRRTRRDVERDDLPDVIDHLDFDWNLVNEIGALADEVEQGYRPRPARIVEMPKDLVHSRPLCDLAIEDRVVLEACVQTIAPHIDAQLPETVFNHRLLPNPRGSRLTRFFARQHARFLEATKAASWEGFGGRMCLKADIASFYEYVDHDILFRLLGDLPDEVAPATGVLRTLFRGLREQHQVLGLPQGPSDASGILAHAYLTALDAVCSAESEAYFRYSDDLRIFFRDESSARRFAPKLIRALRAGGLNLSSAKTELIPSADIARDQSGDRRSAAAYGVENQMVSSIDELRAIFDSAVADTARVNQTDFTFAVWRLGLIEDDHALEWILAHLDLVPFAMNIVADYLSRLGWRAPVSEAVEGYLLSNANVHAWSELHLIRLGGMFDHVGPRVLEFLRRRAFETTGVSGDFAARTLGAIGASEDRRQLQRLAARPDVNARRRRAALLGGADGESSDRQWVRPLTAPTHPSEVQRAAGFVASGAPIPPTLVRRRTPSWAPGLRAAAEAEGKLPRRDPIPDGAR